MNARQLQALRAAVNIARNESIESVRALRKRLQKEGFTRDEVDSALASWRHRLRVTGVSNY